MVLMKFRLALAAFLAVLAAPALAGEPRVCPSNPSTVGMQARMKTMREQMDRIEWTTDRAEQRRLMDLNMKHMHEGVRELRKRDIPVACHLEMMDTMMETMVRHAQLSQEPGPGR
jgi:hypothetical protein